jgi:ribosomal protein S18 acetylase RimI-like enzyme
MGDRVICAVAESEQSLVGVAWLVLYDRVPGPRPGERLTGDVQSVFVQASHRGLGLGSALVGLLIESIEDRPVSSITVQANDRAREFYRRLGFSGSEHLLEHRR